MLSPRELPLLATFVAVSRTGSFTAAASDLRVAKSLVSSHIRQLEERLRVRLFERTTRRVRLTGVGEQVLPLATSVIGAVADIARVVDSSVAGPAGTLRITATHDLGARFVPPILADMTARFPDLRVELVLDDGSRDLVGGGYDLALRVGAPRSSVLIIRKLGSQPEVIVGAPRIVSALSYRSPRDLAQTTWIAHAVVDTKPVWHFTGQSGETQAVTPSTRLTVNSLPGVLALVKAEAGIAVVPRYFVSEDLDSGRLERLCPTWRRRMVSIYALLPAARHPPARTTVFLAALKLAIARDGLQG
jgi:DNA-binding transcriptional LysR family regulator